MMGAIFLLPVFLQNGLGFSPLQTGLLTMPGALMTAALMPISGALFDKFGARPLGHSGFYGHADSLAFTCSSEFRLDVLGDYGGLCGEVRGRGPSNDAPKNGRDELCATITRQSGLCAAEYLEQCGRFGGNCYFGNCHDRPIPILALLLICRILVCNRCKKSQLMVYTLPCMASQVQADMLHLMSVLKQLAFQNGIRKAFIISAIFTVIALISSLFIGKKQSKLIPKKS